MITTEGLNTKVKFGDWDSKASIAVLAKKGTLTLQELAKDKQIGDPLEDGDTKELPKIEMEFTRLESVDIMIKALETIKKNWIEQYQYSLAC